MTTRHFLDRIKHHGARTRVTGSCHELQLTEKESILVDCGLFQGKDSDIPLEIDFPIDGICGLVLTHVHIDHCGRLPYLLAAGFKQPIYCSEASAKMLPIVLEDAIALGLTRNRKRIKRLIETVKGMLRPLPYGKWQEIDTGSSPRAAIRLQRAGHILGSAYVECRGTDPGSRQPWKVVFSGDLGATYAPILPSPKSPYSADIVVLESTYGNRLHEGRKERKDKLQKVIEHALEDRGAILIPAFSIGRTQELLYEIEELIFRNRQRFVARNLPWEELEVILDSPLASRFTKLYRELQPYWDMEAREKLKRGRKPLAFEQMTTINSHRDHLHTVDYLRRKGRPCIVIAASGMCTGGRIVNYLKALIGDPRTDILFSGYQAAGTPGRAIQQYGPGGGYVHLDGRKYDIKARIHSISGYSAHADQKNLLNFIKRMHVKPKHVRLIHGEPDAQQALRSHIEKLGEISVD